MPFFFKGAFGKCFEVQETRTREIYACKVVSKSLLVKQDQKDKMASTKQTTRKVYSSKGQKIESAKRHSKKSTPKKQKKTVKEYKQSKNKKYISPIIF